MRGFLKILAVGSFLFTSCFSTFAQKYAFEKSILQKNLDASKPYLKSNFGKNKKFTKNYNLQCLYTLSYFDELKNTKIIFSHKKIKTTMVCRPRWDFIFRKKRNRTYKIIFNSDTLNPSKVTFDELSFNAQIGVLGHEYSHIIDYNDKSILDLIFCGIFYFTNKKYKEELEKTVDKIAINKGLGWQIYDFSRYVLNESSADDEYKKYKTTFYYTPVEINNILDLSYPKQKAVLEN